jgi:prolyl 4-hydroxylase
MAIEAAAQKRSVFSPLSLALLIPLASVCYFQRQSFSLIPESLRLFYGFENETLSTGRQLAATIASTEQLATRYAEACPEHKFRTHIFSTDPLIIYVEDYLSRDEISYLLRLAVPYYEQSPVSKGYNLKAYDAEIRSSMSAVLPDDPVLRCIEQRSVDFQGYMPRNRLEDIQVVKYTVGDHFRPHFDWFSGMANPRLSTFFVYLACDSGELSDDGAVGDDEAQCEGGATQFPHYEGLFSSAWCKFIDCKDDSGVGGVAFKPAIGNAVYWENLYPNGTGHPGVWHAGMPVKKGRKVGLNIFTRKDKWVPDQAST